MLNEQKMKISDGKISLLRIMVAFLCSFICRALYTGYAGQNIDGDWQNVVSDLIGLTLQIVIFFSFIWLSIYPNRLSLRSIWIKSDQNSRPTLTIALVMKVLILATVLRYGAGIISSIYAYFIQPQEFASAIARVKNSPSVSFLPSISDFSIRELTIILFVPIAEEIIYRGVILNYLLSRYKINTALVFSSAIFALFHGSGYFNAFLGAMYLGLLYIKFHRLDVCIFAHMIANLISSLIDRVFFGKLVISNLNQLQDNPYILFFVICSVVGYLGFIVFNFLRFANKTGTSSFENLA
jgi:membrane protease YdiL (CAAX protease family)